MKRQAEVMVTFKVTFDPDVTSERSVAESIAAVLDGTLDVHQEHGCGTVEIGPLTTGAEVQYYDLPGSACECSSLPCVCRPEEWVEES